MKFNEPARGSHRRQENITTYYRRLLTFPVNFMLHIRNAIFSINGGGFMKSEWRTSLTINIVLLLCVLIPLTVYAQADPQELRKQACEKIFVIILQCQLSADPAGSNCSEVSGIISSPQSKEIITQQRPDGASDSLIDQTLTMTADMCRVACQKAKGGKLYKTSREWMADGGCTIQVTR
jgi:hypothetical protein